MSGIGTIVRSSRYAHRRGTARGAGGPNVTFSGWGPWPADLHDDDEINDWIHEQDRDRSTQELIDGYDASFERLAAAIEALPPELARTQGGLPWLDEHEPSLRMWLAVRDPP